MKTIEHKGWTIKIERGVGGAPDFNEMDFFAVMGPKVKTWTRVDRNGLGDILPEDILRHYQYRYETTTVECKGKRMGDEFRLLV